MSLNREVSSWLVPITSGMRICRPSRNTSIGLSGTMSPSIMGANATVPGDVWATSLRSLRVGAASSSASFSRSSVLACAASMPTRPRYIVAIDVARSGPYTLVTGELWAIARWNRPVAYGEVISVVTQPPPADSPKSVTSLGSPPNAAMLSRTHSRAATMSRNPTLVSNTWSASPNDEKSRNPSAPRR